jgi:hypothetical protein
LTSLRGLENLRHAGTLTITYNPELTSLASLASLTELSPVWEGYVSMFIAWNDNLPQCWVEQLESQSGEACGRDDGSPNWDCELNEGQGTCGP